MQEKYLVSHSGGFEWCDEERVNGLLREEQEGILNVWGIYPCSSNMKERFLDNRNKEE